MARTLEQLDADLAVIPLAAAVAATLPRIDVSTEDAQRISHGQRLVMDFSGSPAGVFAPDGSVIALVEERDGVAQPLCVFA
jgi:tRNA pseudouridine55 synthase